MLWSIPSRKRIPLRAGRPCGRKWGACIGVGRCPPGVGALACPSGVTCLLRVERLAARQHLHHLCDLAGPAFSALHALDAMDQREPVGAREHVEHRLRVRLRRDRRGQVVGRLAGRRTGVRRVPPPIGARGLDRGAPGVGHPALLLERRHERDVSLRPAAFGAARGDAHGVAVLVALAGLAVDPAEAEQLLDRARPRDRGVRAALLGQHQPHAGRRRMVLFEPRPQRGRVGHEQLGQQGCHGSDASRGRRHLRRSGGEPEECAEHEVEPVVASGGAAGQVAGARDR